MLTEKPQEVGSPSMKSIEMSSHTRAGSGSGYSKPAGVMEPHLFR